MSCSPYDLRDYLFEELTPAQHGETRLHLKSCAPCGAELEALRSTHAALLTVRDEEMPQRIGFVSDKVFEPSPIRRWVAGFWTSAARLGFVSAALLSAAIFVHAVRNPEIMHNFAQSTVSQAALDRRIADQVAAQVNAQVPALVKARVDAAVTQAVAETENRAQKRTTELLAAVEKKYQLEQRSLRAEYQANLDYQRSRYNVALVSANYPGGGQ